MGDGTAEGRETRAFTLRMDDAGRRLDRVLRKLLPRASLARIYAGLRRGEARVDGRAREASYRVREGERLEIDSALCAGGCPPDASPLPSAAPQAEGMVVYRNEHLIVFNKPRGIPVHGAESLATVAAGMLAAASRPSLSFRPGPVHRIDKDTSGLVFFAVSLRGARVLSALLRERACQKHYVALLEGELETGEPWRDTLRRDRGRGRTVADPEGDLAVAEVLPLVTGRGMSLAQVRLESGRTHQIRAQAALHGHPLVGDLRYGGRAALHGYVLHAARFALPAGTDIAEPTLFLAPLPAESLRTLRDYFGAERTDRALADLLRPQTALEGN